MIAQMESRVLTVAVNLENTVLHIQVESSAAPQRNLYARARMIG